MSRIPYLMIFLYLPFYKIAATIKKTKITKRDFSDEGNKHLQFLLENIKWDRFLPLNAPNEAINNF